MWGEARAPRHRQVGWRVGRTEGDGKAALRVRGGQDPTGQRGGSGQGGAPCKTSWAFQRLWWGGPTEAWWGRSPAGPLLPSRRKGLRTPGRPSSCRESARGEAAGQQSRPQEEP